MRSFRQAPVYAVIEVKDNDPVGVDTTLGTVFFPLCAMPVRALRQWFPLGRNPGSKVVATVSPFCSVHCRTSVDPLSPAGQ